MGHFYDRGFVQADSLAWVPYGSGFMMLVGQIACLGNIIIKVRKILRVLDGEQEAHDSRVQTTHYAYNASVKDNHEFLRHDNSRHTIPGAQDRHHRHVLDWQTGREREGSPEWVGEAGWLTLGQFIETIQTWYYEHRGELPEPDRVPALTVLPSYEYPDDYEPGEM